MDFKVVNPPNLIKQNQMAHSLAPVTPPVATPVSRKPNYFLLPSPRSTLKVSASATRSDRVPEERNVLRRSLIAMGLALPMLGLINHSGSGDAWAAGRRPPPPPPKEKQDPNVSGALAKILASKKRKEAMKESVAKLRERGKAIEAAQPAAPAE